MTEQVIYYHQGGFYDFPIEGAVSISAEQHLALMEAHYTQNKLIIADQNGYPILIDRPPTDYHEWNGQNWEIPAQRLQAVISAEKSAKLTEINRTAQATVEQLANLTDTPEFERATWTIQAQEATAWKLDPTTPTPTLSVIAQNRGVPLALLRQKAYEKAMAYQQLAAHIAGQRQALEDRLNAAKTLEQVQAIEPVFNLEIFTDET